MKVLDPRIKLGYYIAHQWEKRWIEESKSALFTTFKSYLPPPGQEAQEASDDCIDPRDELSLHLYGRRQGKRTHTQVFDAGFQDVDELEDYLKKNRIRLKEKENESALTWWKVKKSNEQISFTLESLSSNANRNQDL